MPSVTEGAYTLVGITFGFSVEEWVTLETLFRRAWELPEIRAFGRGGS